MDLLRHGGMSRLFDDVRAPSTLGTFLRVFTFGHLRQLDAAATRFLARLAPATLVLTGADQVAVIDIDDTVRRTYRHAKQGCRAGAIAGSRGSTRCWPRSPRRWAPVIAATWLRQGSTNSVRGAATLLAEALSTARNSGATRLIIVRADSAYYAHDIITVCRRADARFSVTARQTTSVTRTINTIPDTAWVPIRYPQAMFDENEQR